MTKIYDKRDDFNFDIDNYPFPQRPCYGVQLLPKIFLDSDFCHNYLHTPVVLN